MNIHIDKDGKRTIRLTKTEIKSLRRAQAILEDLCRFDATLVERLDNWGASGLAELLETPYCQPEVKTEGKT